MRRTGLLLLCLLFITACQSAPSKGVEWWHMVGSNSDELWVEPVLFYRQGKLVDASLGGSVSSVSPNSLKKKDYLWLIARGSHTTRSTPDQVVLEWISFHDKKRYRISLALPAELEGMIAQRYRVKVRNEWSEEQRDNIGLGMATGGYVEAFLRNPRITPDILLARGIAEEIPDSDYNYPFPLSSQYKNAWAEFDKRYGKAYQQYPVPMGMAWAPIMDAYRVAQPKTDTDPVR